jgi:hypothetical protein
MARGRAQAGHRLHVHALVSVERHDQVVAGRLSPEARRLYERASLSPESVAELSAHCGVPLGVTRVLLEDLAAAGQVQINAGTHDSPSDQLLLTRLIDGLRGLG